MSLLARLLGHRRPRVLRRARLTEGETIPADAEIVEWTAPDASGRCVVWYFEPEDSP